MNFYANPETGFLPGRGSWTVAEFGGRSTDPRIELRAIEMRPGGPVVDGGDGDIGLECYVLGGSALGHPAVTPLGPLISRDLSSRGAYKIIQTL